MLKQPSHPETTDVRAAEQFCRNMARREAKNFYWGFMALANEQRIAIYALYNFARQIDDEADCGNSDGLPERLAAQRARLDRALRGEYSDPIMHVLSNAIERYEIPAAELHALIDGVAMDAQAVRFQTWDELQHYCRLVASAVGRMCVRIFGFNDPAALAYADELGLALQLINILRDIREDAGMGRIYIPQEDLARFGIDERDFINGTLGIARHNLVAFEVERARALWASGIRVIEHIPTRAGVCVGTMAGIYRRILDRIARDPQRPWRGRTSLSRREKFGVMIGAWLRAR